MRTSISIIHSSTGPIHAGIRSRSRNVLGVALTASVLLAGAFGAKAAVRIWDGSSSGYWATTANWSGNVAPTHGDDVIFGGATRYTITNNISNLRLSSITFTTNGYTVYGNSMTVSNGVSGQQISGANSVRLNLTMGAAQTFDCLNAGASQNFYGNVTNSGFLLTFNTVGTIGMYNGTHNIAGSGGVTKNGAGTLQYSGDQNYYWGTTYVRDGTLRLSCSAVDAAFFGSLVIGDGVGANNSAKVTLGLSDEIPNTTDVTINSDGALDVATTYDTIGTSLRMNNGEIIGTGTFYLPPNSTVYNTGQSYIFPTFGVGGSGTCTLRGSGWLHLAGRVADAAAIETRDDLAVLFEAANDFSGPVTAWNNSGVWLYNNKSLGGTNAGVTLNDNTWLEFYGVNITNETLTLNSSSQPCMFTQSDTTNVWVCTNVILSANANLDVQQPNGILEIVAPITGTGGVLKTGLGHLIYSGSSGNSYAGNTTVNAGELDLNKSGAVNAIRYGTLFVGDGLGGSYVDVVRYTGTSTTEINTLVNIFINSSGWLDLNGHNDDVGDITFTAGRITTGAGILSTYGPVTANATPTGTASISGGVTLFSNPTVFNVADSASYSQELYISAAISGNGLSKTGAGTLYLTASNSYTGQTLVQEGILEINNDFALGSTAVGTVVSNGATLWASFTVNNISEPLAVSGSGVGNKGALLLEGTISWNTNITLNADTLIACTGAGNFATNRGVISGSGGFTKIGPNPFVLAGSDYNTYTGRTYVNEGHVWPAKFRAIPGPLTIGDGLGGANSDVVRELVDWGIYFPAEVLIRSTGLLEINGNTDDIGPFVLDGGNITTGTGLLSLYPPVITYKSDPTNGVSTIDGNISLRGNTTFSITNDLFIPAKISGPYSITKNGPFDLRLRGSNSYTGLTIIQEGNLWAEWFSTALGTSANGTVVSNGAELIFSGPIAITNEALFLNGNGGLNPALGTVTTGADDYWVGPVTLNANSAIQPGYSSSTLHIVGPINGAGGLIVRGAGKLSLEGSTANTYAGDTTVPWSSANLILKKSIADGAIPHNLIIDGTATLAANSQIADNADITINSGGTLDCATYYDWIDELRGSGNVVFGVGSWLGTGNGNGTWSFEGTASGVGSVGGWALGKYGTGTFTFNGTATYTNLTYVSGGTLIVNGNMQSSPVAVVTPSAKLMGNGTVANILGSGIIAPGTSPGQLTCSNLAFFSGSTYQVELTGPGMGTGYDTLNVRGTNSITGSTLSVIPQFTSPVHLGDQFMIVNNDGVEAVTGTFNGLPNNASISAGGYAFRINYGNDVVLTVTNLPASHVPALTSILGGNGNHGIDPNECNTVMLVISNSTASAMNNVSAVLSDSSMGVMVNQAYSAYPNIPAHGKATNITAFQISTLTNFACGSDINLNLLLSSSTHGEFAVPVVLHSGGPAASPTRYDVATAANIPDVGTLESTNIVAGFTGPLTKVQVSVWITHPIVSDLSLTLIAPDGTSVDLSSGNGAGANFGSACAPDGARTTFDDAAPMSILVGAPPFVGTFRPEGSLAVFTGLTSAAVNGNWRLQITDSFASSLGALRCWSLFLYGVQCAPGGGYCDTCVAAVTGTITSANPTMPLRVTRNRAMSSCGTIKPYPGGSQAAYYATHEFTNSSAADACTTVTLSGCDLQAVAYLNSFNPADSSVNYLGDSGWSTGTDSFGANGPITFSCMVPAGQKVVIVVNTITTAATCTSGYLLQVAGLPCPLPTITAQPLPGNNTRLYWPSWAGGFNLHGTPSLTAPAWGAVAGEPIVSDGKYNVTNPAAEPSKFFRLQQPR